MYAIGCVSMIWLDVTLLASKLRLLTFCFFILGENIQPFLALKLDYRGSSWIVIGAKIQIQYHTLVFLLFTCVIRE